MKRLTLLTVLLLLMLTVIFGSGILAVKPVRASPVWSVNLDANSISQTDIVISPSANQGKSFRIGAVINATATNPLMNVYGWQFVIFYNASAFVPAGDPDLASLYPDGASNTALFGAQTTYGAVNWAGLLAANEAFGSFTVSPGITLGLGEITVFLTLINPTSAVTISANNLLASVQFELLNEPPPMQLFTLAGVIFTDSSANVIPGVQRGTNLNVFETVTNTPPVARFISDAPPQVSPYSIAFNATRSYDSDGTIASPAGYFWDFGDGTQDLGVTGAIVTHDFGRLGTFNVTLRVQDDLGATGSARDSLGNIMVNLQPSHFRSSINLISLLPDFAIKAVSSFVPYQLGGAANSTVSLSSSNAFSGIISLSAIVSPSIINGPLINLSPRSIFLPSNGNVKSNLTLTFSESAPLTEYNVTVTATNGILTRNVTVAFLPTTISVQPSLITGVSKGSTFSVNVTASVAGTLAWQFTLHYDPALLSTSFRSVSFGPFWQNALSNNLGFPIIVLNQTNGTLTVAFSLLAQGSILPSPFTGNATFASIVFTVNGYDNTTLHLSDVAFVDSQQRAIPVSRETDGVFDNRLPHDVAVTTISAQPTSVKAGQIVTIVVEVKNEGLNPETTTVKVTAAGSTIGQEDITLNLGESTILTFNWNTTGTNNGSVIVDAQASITTGDSTPNDNTRSTTVIIFGPMHDVAVTSILASPTVTFSGQLIDIQVGITNKGNVAENVSLTFYYDSQVIATLTGISLIGPPPSCLSCQPTEFVHVVWNTSSVPPGSYTISATVFLATDQNLSNNSLTDGKVTIFPPPTITLTPNSGILGTKVLIRGSGFILPSQPSGSLHIIIVSFDDMFLGTAFSVNGMFNFTFDVPHAEPGPHLIKVLDQDSGLKANATFTVIAEPQATSLAVSVDVGTVYFPGDIAVIYLSTSMNGSPFSSGDLQLKLILFKPDGTNLTLNVILISSGFYKASYSVPSSSSVGTYGIVAKATTAGSSAAVALGGFEVKPAWLSPGARNTMLFATAAGLVGIVGVAWGRSYLRKKERRTQALRRLDARASCEELIPETLYL